MIYTGLVSVTFRQRSIEDIISLANQAGLQSIEWGGDIHVTHGEIELADQVRRLTERSGLEIAAYGSYYRVGHPETGPFEKVLATAEALGALVIRVWAGKQGSDVSDRAYREVVVEDSKRIAELAGQKGMIIAYEYHAGTLTDTCDSAIELIEAVGRAVPVKTYWQPPVGRSVEENLAELDRLSRWLAHVHVFYWTPGTHDRQPLEEGVDVWGRYFDRIRAIPGDRSAMLEFVKDDSTDAFLHDAQTLRRLIDLGA